MTFSTSPNVFGLYSLAQGLFLEVFSRIYKPRPEGDLGAEPFEIAGWGIISTIPQIKVDEPLLSLN